MDGSTVGRGCMTLMVGVIYRQRAIPLAWIVYKGKKGHTGADHHITVLQQLLPLLPENLTNLCFIRSWVLPYMPIT